LSTGDALGILEISRPRERGLGVSGDEGGEAEEDLKREKSPPLDEGGVWSIVEESQLFPLLA